MATDYGSFRYPGTISSAPVGGATAANQVLEIAQLTAINSNTVAVSTAAKQDTGNTSLASIDTKTPTVGQKAMAASSPVVIASDQSAVPISAASLPLPTGAATETTLAAQSAKLPATLGQKAMAASLAVALASDQSAIPVTVASVPLPTGAATAARQDTGNTSLASLDTKQPALGVAISAASSPVTIASDQALSTGAIRSAAGSLTATSQTVQIACSGAQTVIAQMSGTFTGTVTWETSEDSGVTWTSLSGWDQGNVAFSTGGNVSGRVYSMPAYGTHVRARCSAYTSGTIIVTLLAGLGPMPATYVSPVAFFPVQGSAALAGTGTGVQPIQVGGLFQTTPATLTNGQQGALQQDTAQNLLVKVNSGIAGYTKSNTPTYNAYASTSVTTAAYVQLVASTTSAVKQLQIFDSSGQAMIIATGAGGAEVDQIYVPPGGGVFNLAIAASIRVSIKALTATASTGYLVVNYLG